MRPVAADNTSSFFRRLTGLISGLVFQCAAVFALAVFVYANSLSNGFVLDDIGLVLRNAWIRDFSHLADVFMRSQAGFVDGGLGKTGITTGNYYRPVEFVIYMLAYRLFGLNAWGYHLVNALLHGAVTVAVYFTVLEIAGGRGGREDVSRVGHLSAQSVSFLTALIFAAHPIHTEAVNWIATMPEMFFSLFLILSFRAYIKGGTALSALLFLVACFSKETALVLPAILLLYDLQAGRLRPFTKILKRYAPFAAIVLFYFAMRLAVLHHFAPQSRFNSVSGAGLAANAAWLFTQYLVKLAWPTGLNVFYAFHPVSATSTRAISAYIATLVFIAAAFAARKSAVFFTGFVFILLPLLPVLYVRALGLNVFAERYLYLPSFGFALVLSGLLAYLPGGYKPAVIAAAIFVSLYSYSTIHRNPVWKSQFSLWADSVKKTPGEAWPNECLGQAYLHRQMPDKALPYLERALKIDPSDPKFHFYAGLSLNGIGRQDDAAGEFIEALRLAPGFAAADNALGAIYAGNGDFQKALGYFEKARDADPGNAAVYANLGELYLKTGQRGKALESFRKAVSIEPGNPQFASGLRSVQ